MKTFDPSRVPMIRRLAADSEITLNEYVFIKDTNIKTMLYVGDSSAYVEFVIGEKTIKIENVCGNDMSYLYLIFKTIDFFDEWEGPVSYNKRLIAKSTKSNGVINLVISDLFEQKTYSFENLSVIECRGVRKVVRDYSIIMN